MEHADQTKNEDMLGPTAHYEYGNAENGAKNSENSNACVIRVPVHVEICQKPNSSKNTDTIKKAVYAFLQDPDGVFYNGPIMNFHEGNDILAKHVHSINVTDIDYDRYKDGIPVWKSDIKMYVYRLNIDGASEEYTDESEEILLT